jgi:hypothetical protein
MIMLCNEEQRFCGPKAVSKAFDSLFDNRLSRPRRYITQRNEKAKLMGPRILHLSYSPFDLAVICGVLEVAHAEF